MKFGIDRFLTDTNLRGPLAGKRIALLAHPASVTANLTHSMDAIARAFLIADRLLEESDLDALRSARYASFDSGAGERYERGELDLSDLSGLAGELGEPEARSGRQERFEQIVSRYLR